MDPTAVIENVQDDSIWHNSLWVNKKEKVFFVPIWRCGNTSFMFLAEDYGFELTRMTQCHLNSYTGFAFVRHPMKRIIGQLYRAYENNNSDNIIPEVHRTTDWDYKDYKDTSLIVKECGRLLQEAKKGNFVDAHMLPQYKFLENYFCKHIIDLDDKQPTVSHTFINEVLVDFYAAHLSLDGVKKHRQQVEDRFLGIAKSKILTEENLDIIKDIYQKDYELYDTI